MVGGWCILRWMDAAKDHLLCRASGRTCPRREACLGGWGRSRGRNLQGRNEGSLLEWWWRWLMRLLRVQRMSCEGREAVRERSDGRWK